MPRTEALGDASHPHHLGKALLVTTAAAVGVAAVAVAAKIVSESQQSNRPNFQNEQQQPGGVMPSATAYNEGVVATRTPETTVIPTSSPTTAPATATTTPHEDEVKKDVPCGILPEKYCSQGEVIYTKNSQGGEEIYVGFRLPAKVPIFAGMDGQTPKVEFDKGAEFQGSRVTVMDPNLANTTSIGFVAIGDLGFENMFSLNVKEGDTIAHTKNTGVTNLGGYNLIITIRQRTPNGPIPAEELLRKHFPEAFARAAKTLSYQGPENPIPNVSRVFANGN